MCVLILTKIVFSVLLFTLNFISALFSVVVFLSENTYHIIYTTYVCGTFNSQVLFTCSLA